jgi:hemerythrin-like metal-binding protein
LNVDTLHGGEFVFRTAAQYDLPKIQDDITMKRLLRVYPRWLYNSLFYIYLGVGLLTIALLPSLLGRVSGALLIVAGATVWFLRYQYRHEFAQYEKQIDAVSVLDAGDVPAGGLVQFSWSPSYESGHPVIDGQHRRLFGLANEAIVALIDKQPKAVEELLLSKLAAHMAQHFYTEETALAVAGDPNLAEHRQQHRAVLAAAAALFERYHTGHADNKDIIGFLTDSVIRNHIMREDLPWAHQAQA